MGVTVASMATDSQPMVVTDMAAMATARGLLMLRPRPSHGTDMVASTATDSQPMVVTDMAAMATARGPLMPKPSHGTDMVASTATDSQPTVLMAVTPTESNLPPL